MEELREAEERDREKRNRRDYWVAPGIVVKLMNKTLANGKYYKVKGVVQEVIDKYLLSSFYYYSDYSFMLFLNEW